MRKNRCLSLGAINLHLHYATGIVACGTMFNSLVTIHWFGTHTVLCWSFVLCEECGRGLSEDMAPYVTPESSQNQSRSDRENFSDDICFFGGGFISSTSDKKLLIECTVARHALARLPKTYFPSTCRWGLWEHRLHFNPSIDPPINPLILWMLNTVDTPQAKRELKGTP